MSDLKEFQQAAVERICERLTDASGSGRFLLADEVGLGKTMVARGVLDTLDQRRRGRLGMVCVYLCSSLEIAEQNRDKLSDEDNPEPPIRLTLITLRAKDIQEKKRRKRRQLFLFTPGTSLQLGAATGIKAERRLLLACLYGLRRRRISAEPEDWIEFFRCSAGQRSESAREQWAESCDLSELRREVRALRKSGLYQRVVGRWEKARAHIQLEGQRVKDKTTKRLLDAVEFCVAELGATGRSLEHERRVRRNRNAVIGALRQGVAEAALDFLAPDVILVDEFQRFKEVIKLADDKDSLAGRLFAGDKRPQVLILSATPYKAVTFDHEKEDHYQDLQRTLTFLLGHTPDKARWVEEVNKLLLEFKGRLTEDHVDFPKLLSLKDRLEERLRTVMCRTERSRYLLDQQKGIEERPGSNGDKSFAVPSTESLCEFVALRSFLHKHDTDERPLPSIMDFWKSCSSIITFMDSGYALTRHLREKKVRVDSQLLTTESALKGLVNRNLKLETLAERLSESCHLEDQSKQWRFLWTRPTYFYHQDEFFEAADPAKFVVFSRWRFVPKAISYVISSEFEASAKGPSRPLELSAEILKVCMPFVCLADLVDTAGWASEHTNNEGSQPPSTGALRQEVKARLRSLLKQADIKVVKKAGRKQFWPALFALERWYLQHHADSDSERRSPVDTLDVLADALEPDEETADPVKAELLLKAVKAWTALSRGEVIFPEEMLSDAVAIATSSPAIALLRSIRALFPVTTKEVLIPVTHVAFQDLRTYFNKGYVQTVIKRHARSGRYSDKVLRYCFDAHFQSVIDEYAYLLRRVLQRKDVAKCAEHIGRAMSLGASVPNINVPSGRSGRIREKRSQRAVNFAMAFGEENQPEETAESRASRKTGIRESFNSPFWPFVLATTSIGQEGLDFHLYCRDVMHWNLPSNPVDLEQREGRINRFDGLTVRRNVANDYPLSAIPVPNQGRSNVWDRVFQHVEEHPHGNQQFKHGLFPHWVFEPIKREPQRIRRHLAFFEGSRDLKHYEKLKKYLFYYRLAFGQARQQDLLDRIVDRPDEARLRASLAACMVNLSPFSDDHSWERAQRDARAYVAKPLRLRALVEQTHDLFTLRRGELLEVEEDLDSLWRVADRVATSGRTEGPEDVGSIAALIYLLNPYDKKFDGIADVGLEDDVAILRGAAKRAERAKLVQPPSGQPSAQKS